MDIDITDDAVLIDDKDSPLGVTLGGQDAVLFGDCAVRPEIAEEGIVDPTQAVSPGFETGDMIDADAQDLGI
jgi:hypothetical protein